MTFDNVRKVIFSLSLWHYYQIYTNGKVVDSRCSPGNQHPHIGMKQQNSQVEPCKVIISTLLRAHQVIANSPLVVKIGGIVLRASNLYTTEFVLVSVLIRMSDPFRVKLNQVHKKATKTFSKNLVQGLLERTSNRATNYNWFMNFPY